MLLNISKTRNLFLSTKRQAGPPQPSLFCKSFLVFILDEFLAFCLRSVDSVSRYQTFYLFIYSLPLVTLSISRGACLCPQGSGVGEGSSKLCSRLCGSVLNCKEKVGCILNRAYLREMLPRVQEVTEVLGLGGSLSILYIIHYQHATHIRLKSTITLLLSVSKAF